MSPEGCCVRAEVSHGVRCETVTSVIKSLDGGCVYTKADLLDIIDTCLIVVVPMPALWQNAAWE